MDLSNIDNKINKKIPAKLDDCFESNSLLLNINLWANRIDSWGGVLCVIIIVAGFITAISSSAVVVDYSYFGGNEYDFSAGTFFSVLITYAIYAFVELIAYNVIYYLLKAIADIAYNTKVATDLAILNYKKNNEKITDVSVVSDNQNAEITDSKN